MTDTTIAWPKKTRELHNHHMNSAVWNGFKFRDDDVIVATYGKAGTTWTQQIVGQLVHGGRGDIAMHELSPWIDLRIMPPEAIAAVEHQQHRRVVKTHLPLDALVFSPTAKYLYIGRDGRDVIWSMYNHHTGFKPEVYDAFNLTPGLVGPPMPQPDPDIRNYFRTWLNNDGAPFWSFWENLNTWWAARHLPNVHFVHFNNLKADLPGEMRAIASFLDIDIAEEKWPALIEHCTFDYMKAHSDLVSPGGGMFFIGGGDTFINKGSNGRWRDILSPEESAQYEAMALEKLGPDCARWLMTGEGA